VGIIKIRIWRNLARVDLDSELIAGNELEQCSSAIFGSGAAAPNSTGRLDFGIGKGYRYNEFAGFCVPMEEAEARLDKALDVIFKASMTATSAASP